MLDEAGSFNVLFMDWTDFFSLFAYVPLELKSASQEKFSLFLQGSKAVE